MSDCARQIDLISVHTPKCGGSSLMSALRRAFDGRLYLDYADFPADPAARMHLDPDGFLADAWSSGYPWLEGRRAVHGHFWLRKYDRLDHAARVTFLRDPVDRVISLYFYWLESEDTGHPMVRYLSTHRPDVARFAEMEWTRRFLTGRLFRDVDVGRFDLIGFHDRMGEGIARLSGLLGRPVSLPVTNTNRHPRYAEAVARIKADPALMDRLYRATAEERRFYELALARFG